MQEIFELIEKFKLSDEKELIIDTLLDNKQRGQVHEYCKKLSYSSETFIHNLNKHIRISKSLKILNDEAINFFIKMSKIPIPVTKAEYMDYYLNVLAPYYKTHEMYTMFLRDIKNNFRKFQHTFFELSNKIKQYIQDKKEFKEFGELKITDMVENKKANIFSSKYDNKFLLSIDIKEANFTAIKFIMPSLIDNKENWCNFIKQFTDSDFIINSKHFREITFGKLGIDKKLSQIYKNLFFQIKKFIPPELELIQVSNDEMIFLIGTDDREQILNNIAAELNNFYHNYFRVELFQLIRIHDKNPFYVKKFSNNNIKFCNIPRNFLLQAIKYYNKQEITELDKKFLENDLIATYDNSIFY